MIDGLKDKYRTAIIDIVSANQRVERAVLFGSRAMGTFTTTSDVDIVLFGENLTMTDQAKLAQRMDELSMPRRVDLLLHKSIKNEKLLEHIRRHGVEWCIKRPVLAKKWHECTLEELTVQITDCPHSSPKWTNSGVVVLRNQNIRNGRLDLSSPSYTTEAGYDYRTKRATPRFGDLVLTREAPMGEVCAIPEGLKCCLGQRMVLIRPDARFLNSRFLLFAFQGPDLQHQISWNEGTGTTVSNIRIPNIKSFKIGTPPLATQRAIAHILGSLDDKIELNRQMNSTFEQMAQAIFKSWFIDFDPVHAKAEGRDTGLPSEIADLFPDSFDDSELGMIPAGWKVRSLDEIAVFLNGLACQKYPTLDEEPSLPVIKIRELRNGISENTDRVTAEVPAKHIVNDTDVLFSWSGTLMVKVWTNGRGVLNQHVFKVTSETFPKWFYHFWITYHLPEFQRIASDKATTMGHIKRHHLSEAKVVIPPSILVNAVTEHIHPLFHVQIENDIQSSRLCRARDILLPKLVSGELSIPTSIRVPEGIA